MWSTSGIGTLYIILLTSATVVHSSISYRGIIPGRLDWCAYWRKLNITKRECNGIYSFAAALAARRILDVPAIGVYALPRPSPPFNPLHMQAPTCLIQHPYAQCVPSLSYVCETGQICVQNDRQCCSPTTLACPSIERQRYVFGDCATLMPTNWCNVDSDCHTTPTRRCCPTGCRYNVCMPW